MRAEYVVDQGGCWIWQGRLRWNGYGVIDMGRTSKAAHRVAYEAARGAVPAGMVLDHLCRVRACVNPDHLEAVSNAVNIQRGNTAVLTPDLVRFIRKSPVRRRALAAQLGVSVWTIDNVRQGKRWTNITDHEEAS